MVKKKSEKIINWDEKEYIVRERNVGWYVGLVVITLALAALAIWIQEYTFLILVVLCAVVLVIYSVRPPRKLHYSISNKGISEGKIDTIKNMLADDLSLEKISQYTGFSISEIEKIKNQL